MMKILFAIVLVIAVSIVLFGQEQKAIASSLEYPVMWKSYNHIMFEGKTSKFSDSEQLFRSIPVAHDEYNRAMKSRKTSKVMGYSSLLAIPVGLLLIDADPATRNTGGITIVGGLLTFIGTPVFGIIGLLSRSEFKRSQKKTIQLFNGLYEKYNDGDQSVKLTFGTTSAGIGCTIHF